MTTTHKNISFTTILLNIFLAIALSLTSVNATTITDTTATFDGTTTTNGNIVVTGTVDGVDIAALNTIVGGVTAAEMDQIEAIGTNVITAAIWARVAGLDQAVGTGNAVVFTTVNTGQGAYELYAMDQNVQTTSNVSFNKAILAPAQAQVGLVIDQNNAAQGLNIDSEAPASSGIYIDMLDAGTGQAIYAQRTANEYVDFVRTDADTVGSNYFYRNLAAGATGGPVVIIDDNEATDDQDALQIEQSGTGHGIRITNANTGQGLVVDQNGNGIGINIDTEATTQPALSIDILDTSTGNGISVARNNSDYAAFVRAYSSSTGSNIFYRDMPSGLTAGPVLKIDQNNVADDQNPLYVASEGTGAAGYFIRGASTEVTEIIRNSNNQYGTNLFYRNLNSGNTAGPIVYIRNVNKSDDRESLLVTHLSNTTNAIFYRDANDQVQFNRNWSDMIGSNQFYRNLGPGQTAGPVLNIRQDHASDDQPALNVLQDGSGQGLFIDQNGAGNGLEIDHDGASGYGLSIDTGTAFYGGAWIANSAEDYVRLSNNNTYQYGTHRFYRNLASGSTAGPVTVIANGHASDDQPALQVSSSATAKASFRIVPQASPPTACEIGDIYVDTSGAFCACSATNKWNNTISTGTCA